MRKIIFRAPKEFKKCIFEFYYVKSFLVIRFSDCNGGHDRIYLTYVESKIYEV